MLTYPIPLRHDAAALTVRSPCSRLERDDFSSNRHPAPAYWWSMIFSENRYPPRIKSGAGFFGIMLQPFTALGRGQVGLAVPTGIDAWQEKCDGHHSPGGRRRLSRPG